MMQWFCLFVAAISVACSSDGDASGSGDFRPSTPEVSEVTQTAATLTSELRSTADHQRRGFLYGLASESVSKYRETTDVKTLSNGTFSARLTGLKPGSSYRAYAFVEVNGRVSSAESAEFSTTGRPDDEPSIEITSAQPVTVKAAGSEVVLTYKLYNAPTGAKAEATCEEGWISEIDNSAAGRITLVVGENSGAARSAVVTLSYEGAEPVEATLNQQAADETEQIEPECGKPSVGSVTSESASVTATLTYTGTEKIESVWFGYKSSSGSEQQTSLSASTGTKSATLASLAASTTYTVYLGVKIGGVTFKSASTSFTTEGTGGGGNEDSGARYTGWAELPAEVDKSGDYYYAYHMRSDNKSVRNYSICYSADKRCAIWTAMPIHNCYDGSAGRNDSWDYDPIIPKSVQPDLSSSYKGVYSRGHMVASSDRQVSVATNRQTFYYTNMAPQYQNHFNGGIWQKLETWCWDKKCADTLYVVTGAHFANTNKSCSDADGKSVKVPTHFYKVLIRSKNGNTGKPLWKLSASEIICVGFWFEHNESYATNAKPSSQYMKSVADIEQLTGFSFFPNVPDAPKSSYKASDWGM